MKAIKIKDETVYAVALARVIERGARKYLPRDKHQFKGSVIAELVETYGWEAFENVTAITR